MKMPSFDTISWQCSEKEYREYDAINYSSIAGYAKEGFEYLLKMDEKYSSPSLVFGSALDTMLTSSEEEFNKKFFVFDEGNLSSTLKIIADTLYNKYALPIDDIKDEEIIEAIGDMQFWNNLSIEKRVAKIKTPEMRYYYNALMNKGDKELINSATFIDVHACAEALKSAPCSSKYFNESFDEDIELHYQLKFKTNLGAYNLFTKEQELLEYKCMVDCIRVDHKNKTIELIDLKTTRFKEYEFAKAVIKYRYDIQAVLYCDIVQNYIYGTTYGEYKVLPFKFICINRYSKTPLKWEYEFSGGGAYNLIVPGESYKMLAQKVHRFKQKETKPTIPEDIDKDNANPLSIKIKQIMNNNYEQTINCF